MHAIAKTICPVGLAIWLLATPSTLAQTVWHFQNKADAPPGAIGQRQLLRGGPLPGYFQPVEVTAPAGTLISSVGDGGYSEPKREKLLAGMLIGPVYRLKVGGIRGEEGREVFPTIEVIDRLYPPPGQAARFPIPIVLTQEELDYALDGRYVLRVIYVEDNRSALPVREVPGEQRYHEVAPGQDAMEVADRLGRPVAILRMGSRVPLGEEDQSGFVYQYPPVFPIEPPTAVPRTTALEEPLLGPNRLGQPMRNFPREPATQWR
jgi:hypothetical protein